jgi:hypothetical protein
MKDFQRLFAIVLFGITHHLHAEVVLDAANICPTTQFGLLYGCAKLPEEKQISFQPNKVTEPKVAFLNSTPITNKLNYKFECKTSRQFNVGLKIHDKSHAFFWNQSGDIETTYKLGEQGNKNYSLIFQPPSTSTPIWPGCVVNIVTNVSYPDADVLREYANFLSLAVSDLVSLQGDIDVSVELPAKWAVLKSSPNRIATVITDLSIEVSAFKEELEELQKDATGSPEVTERKEVLTSLIESYNADIDILTKLSRDIKDVTSVGTQCESTTPDAYCLEKVSTLAASLNKIISDKTTAIESFNEFIDSEVTRLRSISVTISNALKKVKVSTPN